MIRRFMKAACALAAIAFSMETMAAEDAALAQWRMAMATNGYDAYDAVRGRVKVPQDVRQSIWKAYREHIGYEGVQMSKPKLVSTNEFGAVYDLPFTTSDGAKHNFGVNVSSPRNQPFYWICTESSQGGKLSDAGLESYVRDRFFSGGMGESRVSSSVGTLSDGAVVSLGFAGEEVKSPFSEYYFVFIDDCPLANWGHPARCAFVKSDLTAFAVLYVNMPARATVGGADVEMRFWGEAKDGTKATTRARSVTRSVVSLAAAGAKGVFREIAGGDASNCYALLISGGGDERNNHGRYWNDICFAYNVLHLSYKLPRTNIKVLWAKGNPNSDLCWKTGKCCWKTCLGANAFPSTSLCDFDQDGNDDITGAATAKNVSAVLNEYAASLKSTDQLFIFVTDHGNKGTSRSDKEPAVLCMWGGEISDVQFANLTKNIKCPVMVALETCYSGGMVEEFLSSGQNRIIATADGFDSSQDGNHAMDVWVYNFFSALCGYYPGGTYYLHNSEVAPVDVRSVGKSCNADYDGDGKISFFEAAQFAFDNNPIRNDIPENHTSTANLHKKLFMTQYADAPPVVVKEKVLKPMLSPASGSLGHAPCTITATCGTAGATIRFTTDGSDPTATSAVYQGPTSISTDMTVSIRAFKSGMEASDVTRVSYVFLKAAPEKALITSVSQGDSTSGIVVSWSGGAGTESYDLLRGESSAMSSTTTIASGLAASTTSYADLTASPGKTYYYQIRSRNKYGTTLSVASQGAYLMLNPPTRVSASVASIRLSQVTVNLSWQPTTGASSYRVYRQGPGGSLIAVSDWQSSCTFSDTAAISGGVASFVYYVQSASDAAGTHPSAYSEPVHVEARMSGDDVSLECDDWIVVKPGGTGSCSVKLRYSDGTYEYDGFTSGVTCSLVSGNGVSVSVVDGSYDWQDRLHIRPRLYVPPSIVATASSWASNQRGKAVVQFEFGDVVLAHEVGVAVCADEIVRSIELSSMPFVVPGFTEQVSAKCKCYSGATADEADVEVKWAIIDGRGATIDEDGELTAWNIGYRTNVVVQASVETFLGIVTATRKINVSPATIEQKTVELPPLGGSYTNYFGVLNTATYGEFTGEYWLSGICWNSSSSPDPRDINGTISVGGGRNTIDIFGYLFLSFNADRNPGKDRETTFKLRWDGGGLDFRIFQREAPYAKNPVVSGGANGTITANSTTDGSVLHYATDGEEPSANSPVLSNRLDFNESTALAVKAFGEWMQASDTVYADVVGKDSQWDEVEISFSAGQAGLATPGKRTYKVNETFGELPSFPRTNGLYFKGWSLHEGSDKLVSATDFVPSQSATLYAVWSPVEEDKPQWTALPWNFKSAMSATMKVYDDTTGTYLDPSVCIVGIEDVDGLCRGSSENGFGDMQSELNGQDGLYVFGVYSQIESGQEAGLRIRIWNRQKGFMDVLTESLDFVVSGTAGSENEPFVVHVATGSYLKFNANGGTVGEASRRIAEGAEVGELPLAKRDGYAFLGWYTAKDGGAKVSSATKMVGYDVTLYAHWEPLAVGSCPEKAIPFPFGASVATYPVALAKEWMADEGRYDEVSGVLYCKSSVARGKVYTIALPVGQEFEVACADAGAVVAYATSGALRYCRIDARNLSTATAELVLAAYGAVGARTTVYVAEGDLVPAGAAWEDPDEGGLPGSCPGKATAFAFGPSVAAKSVRIVREWDEDGERYLDGGVHYLAATAPASGRLTVAVPSAAADGCAVSCAGNAVAEPELFGGLAFWIFDVQAGDEVIVRLAGARGADVVVYAYGGDYLAKKLIFDPNGGTCPMALKEVRAGAPVGELPTPARGGFAFEGWYTAREGGARVTETTPMVGSDVTLYAQWEAIAAGSYPGTAVGFAFTPKVATYNVALAKEWDKESGRYDEESGVLYCKSTVSRGKVYTIALPVGWEFDVSGDDATMEYATHGSLRYCRIDTRNLSSLASESTATDLLDVRTAKTGDVVPGVWHANLDKAREYAELRGLPLVAVWSNGDECSRCVAFENCVMSPAFRNWMRDSGIVFYFGERNDASDGQEGYHGTSFYWCCKNQNATMNWPYVRVYWPKGGVDVVHSGSWYDGEDLGAVMRCFYADGRTDIANFIAPGDYGTYNPGGRRIISVLAGTKTATAVMPVGGGVVDGGILEGYDASVELVLAVYGPVGARTTVYVSEGDLMPANAVWEDPAAGGFPGSCLGKATTLAFAAGVQAKAVRLVREWDEDAGCYVDGGVHYLRVMAPAGGQLTVAVPAASADGCEVACAGATVSREDFDGLALWIFDARENDEVLVRLVGARGADATVYTFGGDYLAKNLLFDPNGGACALSSKAVRAGQPVGELPTAARDGYAFLGWYTARDGGAKVTTETTMVNYDVTLYARWEAIAVGAYLGKPVPFAFTTEIASYNVALAKEWDEESGRYDEAFGVLHCAATVKAGKVYTMAVPKGTSCDAWCENADASVTFGSDASLAYVRIDTTGMAAGEARLHFAAYGDPGQRTTVYAVEADVMPKH